MDSRISELIIFTCRIKTQIMKSIENEKVQPDAMEENNKRSKNIIIKS